MRDINTYQSIWDYANDIKALNADTKEDYISSLKRRFFVEPSSSLFDVKHQY